MDRRMANQESIGSGDHVMRRNLILALALLPASGCAIIDRLDTTNQQLTTVNGQLAVANQQVAQALQKLDETNRRIDVVDQAILKLPSLRPDPVPAPAPATPAPSMPARRPG